MRALLLLALLAAPTASALDALDEARFGATEARLLVRLRDGGVLHVSADAPVRVAVVEPGTTPTTFVDAPATFDVEARHPGWHGLPGTVEVVLLREGGAPVRVELDDGASGVAYAWPEARETPGAPALVAVLAAAWLTRAAVAPSGGSGSRGAEASRRVRPGGSSP